jgi:TorA maturation chaperone TorD
MREPGFQETLRADGGVGDLTRRVTQPFVSTGTRVPDSRSPFVEGSIDEVDAARAQEYALVSAVLARAPDRALLQRISELRGDTGPLSLVHMALAEAAASTPIEQVEREFFDLFIGLGRGELLPYGSYYLTGFLHERPLARLRGDLLVLGIERTEDQSEPEDHAAIECEIMAGLIARRFGAPSGSDEQFFRKHLASWIGRFFADLEQAKAAQFYRHVGALGRVFIQIEMEAFALPA